MDFITHKIIIEVFDLLKIKIGESEKASETNDLAVLDHEAKKQALELQMAHAQAKVAQEIAIAQRIESADEVILEEYYEGEIGGKTGANVSEKGLSFEASGGGGKISKRVYRFVGGQRSEAMTQVIESDEK